LRAVQFSNNDLIECEFNEVDIAGTDFDYCEIINPKFNRMKNMDSATFNNTKISNSHKSILVKWTDNLKAIFHKLEIEIEN
jgi:uncharacterized protein YjbI with pentapeptide repeats